MSKLPNDKLNQLIRKGVRIPNPDCVQIDEAVNLDRISASGVIIFAGSKVFGQDTLICEGARIGDEGPATVVNCYVGPQVALRGGFFQEAAFLKKSTCGLGAHVRQGTILEEESSVAHMVGLKQTILFPFVTLGSLINFCDCLMAGGTSRQNHSEVGSSYIHFNYTPNQDKATPSLMGDVPRGVMLNQSPVFLGGQGGLVGPCRLAYGTVTAAGTICRKDQLEENHLIMEGGPRSARIPFKAGGYRNLKRVLNHNFNYIGNLMALKQWYEQVRFRFIGEDFPQELADGLVITLNKSIAERVRQLGKLKGKLETDVSTAGDFEKSFCRQWPQIQEHLRELQFFEGQDQLRDQFSEAIAGQIKTEGKDYLRAILRLGTGQASTGSQWLQSIVDHVTDRISSVMNAALTKSIDG